MGRSDAAIRRCWQEWVDSVRFQRHDGSVQPKTTADRVDRLIVRSAVTAPDSLLSTIRLFGDKSRFQLCPHDHRRHVWRHPGQRADSTFTIERHTDPRPEVMQENARPHTARVAMNCLTACQTLPWPSRSSDSSLIEHVLDMMGRYGLSSFPSSYIPRLRLKVLTKFVGFSRPHNVQKAVTEELNVISFCEVV
ncbi:transposable element Tc1 transposase [Trichonephila clavipes]|nr:transposable element Tc1 transposase [Trichonephila clavipes]